MGENKSLDRLRNECESPSFWNRPLRPAELNMLVTMYDYFRFDEAYILQLLSRYERSLLLNDHIYLLMFFDSVVLCYQVLSFPHSK